jgi:hypothetical protein
VVNLGYVLNVIEDQEERAATLRQAWGFSRQLLAASDVGLSPFVQRLAHPSRALWTLARHRHIVFAFRLPTGRSDPGWQPILQGKSGLWDWPWWQRRSFGRAHGAWAALAWPPAERLEFDNYKCEPYNIHRVRRAALLPALDPHSTRAPRPSTMSPLFPTRTLGLVMMPFLLPPVPRVVGVGRVVLVPVRQFPPRSLLSLGTLPSPQSLFSPKRAPFLPMAFPCRGARRPIPCDGSGPKGWVR